MTEVFAVWEGAYEDRTITGLYATLEAAQRDHRHHEWDEPDGDWWDCAWSVPEVPPHNTEGPVFTTLSVPVHDGVAVLPDGRTVETDALFVAVPLPPPAGTWFDIGTPAQSCDASIQRMDVLT